MFRRRPAEVAGPDSDVEQESGKGRPTPKRRESEKNRRHRAAAPRDRKEAYRQSRERARAERSRNRDAMLAGDERFLPERDRGAVRRFTRDFVDSRRSAGEIFLPALLVILALTLVPAPQVRATAGLVQVFIFVILIVDILLLSTRLGSQLRRRFPDQSHRGATMYGVLRAMQIRRWRLPKPRVKAGTRL